MKGSGQGSCVDIVIAGAGMVGTPLACVLGGQGWSVVLLDEGSQSLSRLPPATDALTQRCTALNLGTKQWFDRNHLWAGIQADACPIEQVLVSHKGYFGATRLSANELDVEALGFVVNNDKLCEAMLKKLADRGVQYVTSAKVESVQLNEDTVCIKYRDTLLHTKLLLAADGVASVVRDSTGIGATQVSYDQAAVRGTLALEVSHKHVAYERFTDSGPLALLPRPGNLMSFVECIDAQDMHEIRAMNDIEYLNRLQHRFGHRLGRFNAVGARFVSPLLRIEAKRQTAHRTVFLGNAMRLLHPVGGQGYNLAIRDLGQLQQLLARQKLQSDDPGSASLLKRFVERRIHDQKRTVEFTDALARCFRGSSALPAHLRALGLTGMDTVSPLRKHFAQMTMGLAG